MRLSSYIIAASVLAAAVSAKTLRAKPQPKLRSRSTGGCSGTSYDFFELVTQWDITGLWPTDTDGNYPCDCTNEAFDVNQVQSIMPALDKYWPSLNSANSEFWSHEWSKHGTCAGDVFASQFDFFNSALQARSKFDIGTALADQGITPSSSVSFTMSQFKDATKTAFGYPAIVTCDSNGNIEEVMVCLDKNLNPLQCPSSQTDDCNTETLYLPAPQ